MALEDRQRRLRFRTGAGRRRRTEGSLRSLVAPLVRAQRRRLILMSISSILGGLAEAAMLVLIARIAFALASDSSNVTINFGPINDWVFSVGALIGIAAGLVLIRMGFQVVQTILASRATVATVSRVRTSLIRRFLAANWALQAQQRDGRLQELATTYSAATASAVSNLTGGAIAGFNLLALLVTALAVSPIASLAAAAAALLVGLVLRPLRLAVRRRSAGAAASNLKFATGLTELTSNLQEVRVFRVETSVGNRLSDLVDESAERSLGTAYLSGAIGVVYQGIAMFFLVGALAVGYGTGFARLSSLGAVVLIMLRSLSYAQSVQSYIQGLHQAAPLLETLQDEEARHLAAAIPHDGQPIDHIGDLAFDGVWFEYEQGVPVLQNISFSVPHGEIIGIVGPSGAGKSTMVQLLLRLREPTKGTLQSDGHDVHELSLDDWYRHFTFVPQEPRLFSGTIADNIRFFREDVDDAAVERAAKLAHLHEEISGWPLGYDTVVGERGSQLSGGQRQRLCIARALVDEPDVMILDEPTSSLDVKSDMLIRETLFDLAPHTTVFVIADRMSTLSICDRIMVIFEGKLQGFDQPAKLEATDPFYAEALRLSGMR